MNNTKDRIQIFYACDKKFLKYTVVSLTSLMENASKQHRYCVHILHTDIDVKTQESVKAMENDNFSIVFDDVAAYLTSMKDKLPIRDYYTKTTYFRLFIAEMYPDVKKAIYLDSDTVVPGDISRLYAVDVRDHYLGACVEQVMAQTDVYGTYVERVLGIDRRRFFNAGVLLINCKRFRKDYVLEQFLELLHVYPFVVTQDEDYLNVICQGKVKYLDPCWNVETYGEQLCQPGQCCVIHYIMTNKPWHYKGGLYEPLFWKYAAKTPYYQELLSERDNYTDEQKENDRRTGERLAELAAAETARPDNYLNSVVRKTRAPDRVAVLEKIAQYEREGRFDEDVEDDPPAPPLPPEKIDYLRSGPVAYVKTKFAFFIAHVFVHRLMKKKQMIIKEIRGIEHFKALDSGAVITCNHFNAFDSFAIQLTYEAAKQKKRKFYRIIREGNYTGFPGFYGFLMRNCDTLPLSSDSRTMRKFIRANDQLLQRGHFILIYPEQSMWWNYRKPKPLKPGGFSIAAKNKVPVLPCFITMRDSNVMGADGFYVQEYTVHVCEPIYPDPNLSYGENVQMLAEKNYAVWKEIYEREYGAPLTYTTQTKEETAAS